jgi:hypothetical protein
LDADLQKPEWQYEYAGDWQMDLRRMAQDTEGGGMVCVQKRHDQTAFRLIMERPQGLPSKPWGLLKGI